MTAYQKNKRNVRYLPYVFTEQGIAMLSGLLKNETAVQISINIMNAFVEMRKFIMSNSHVFERLTNIEYKLLEHDAKFDILFNELQKEFSVKQKIFFSGQIYDAHSLVVDLIKSAKKNIIIIDNYIDKSILDLLSCKNETVAVKIITNTKNLKKLDVDKFNKQYSSVQIINRNDFHDRFVIIDDVVYHVGASLKDLGKKCFAISKMEDKALLEKVGI